MAIDPKSLTVDYKDLLKNTGFKKQELTGQQPNDEYKKRLASLSPTDIARGLKPEYLTKGDMKDALSGDKSKSQAGGGDGDGRGPGGNRRGPGGNRRGPGGPSEVQERQLLTNEQKQAIRDLKDGNIAITDPRAAFLNKLDEKGLKDAGIERHTDRNNTEYRLIPSDKKPLTDDEVRERSKPIVEGENNPRLAAIRAKMLADLDKDPETKALLIKTMIKEGDRKGMQVNLEQVTNYANANKMTIKQALNSGFFGPVNHNIAQQHKLTKADQEAYDAAIEKVRAGSNRIDHRIDQGTTGDPNYDKEQDPKYRPKVIDGVFFADHPEVAPNYAKEQKKLDEQYNKDNVLPPDATPAQIEEARQKLNSIDQEKDTETRMKKVGKLVDDLRKESDPQSTADSSTIRKFDRKNDDLGENNQRLFHQGGRFVGHDGKELDKRLIHMVKEASKDLPPGYRVEMISGADPRDSTKNHPGGIAMDVKIYNDKNEELAHNRNSPGWKYYEQLHRSTVHRGKELYPGVETAWGGAWNLGGNTPADAMHLQILDTKRVPGSSPGSGAYDFKKGLPKNFRFPDGTPGSSVAMSDEERDAYDKKVIAKMEAERQTRIAKAEKAKEPKTGTVSPVMETPKTAESTEPKQEPKTAEPEKKPETKKAEASKPTKTASAKPDQKAESSFSDSLPTDLAQGGDIPIENTDQVTAVPVPEVRDSGGRENVGIMQNEKMVARVNSEEQLKYNDKQKKIEVTPEHKVKPEQLERNEKAKDDNRRENEETQRQQTQNTLSNNPPYSPNRDFINPVVPTDHVLNTSQHRHFERAQYFAGSRHYNHGATNERGGV